MSNGKQKFHKGHEANFSGLYLEVVEAPPTLQTSSQEGATVTKRMSKKSGLSPAGGSAKIIVELSSDEPPAVFFKNPPTKVKDPHGRAKSIAHEINTITIPRPD